MMGRRREDVPYQGMGGRGGGWGGQREGSTGSLRGREIRTWGSKKKTQRRLISSGISAEGVSRRWMLIRDSGRFLEKGTSGVGDRPDMDE